MKVNQAFIGQIEDRYGMVAAQGMRDNLKSWKYRKARKLELEQLDNIQQRFRLQAKASIARYRSWLKAYAQEQHDMIKGVYSSYEGIYLRGQVRDAYNLYRIANKDYHELKSFYTPTVREELLQLAA